MADDFPTPDGGLDEVRAWLRRLAAALFDDRLRGKVDPSDLAQDALLKAWAHRDDFRGLTAEQHRAWLRRILENTLAEAVRRYLAGQKRNVGREQSLDDARGQAPGEPADGLADGRTPPPEAAARNEQVLWLAEGLAALPEEQRRAVRLKHLDGLPVEEIARRMGKTEDAVAGLLRRGLATLRQRPGGA